MVSFIIMKRSQIRFSIITQRVFERELIFGSFFKDRSICLFKGLKKSHVTSVQSAPKLSVIQLFLIQPLSDRLPCRTASLPGGTQWRSYLEGTVHQLDANRLTHLHNAPLWDGPEDYRRGKAEGNQTVSD